jgi:hypothetical protein
VSWLRRRRHGRGREQWENVAVEEQAHDPTPPEAEVGIAPDVPYVVLPAIWPSTAPRAAVAPPPVGVCPLCARWKCSRCGWVRRNAARATTSEQFCHRCAGEGRTWTSGELLPVKHHKPAHGEGLTHHTG